MGAPGEGDWGAELDEVRSMGIEERRDEELEREIGPIPRPVPAKLKPTVPANGGGVFRPGNGAAVADPFAKGLHVDDVGRALERDARVVMRESFDKRDLAGMAAVASHLAILLRQRFIAHVISRIGDGGVALYLHSLDHPTAHKDGLYRVSTEKILARVAGASIPSLTRRATETLREAWRAFLSGADGNAAAHVATLVKEGGILRPESYVWFEFLSDVVAIRDVLSRVPQDSEEHFRLSFILSIRLQGFDPASVRRNVFNGNGVVESGRVAGIYVPLVHRVVSEIHARRAFPDERFDWRKYFDRHDDILRRLEIGPGNPEHVLAAFWQVRFGRFDAVSKQPDQVVWAHGDKDQLKEMRFLLQRIPRKIFSQEELEDYSDFCDRLAAKLGMSRAPFPLFPPLARPARPVARKPAVPQSFLTRPVSDVPRGEGHWRAIAAAVLGVSSPSRAKIESGDPISDEREQGGAPKKSARIPGTGSRLQEVTRGRDDRGPARTTTHWAPVPAVIDVAAGPVPAEEDVPTVVVSSTATGERAVRTRTDKLPPEKPAPPAPPTPLEKISADDLQKWSGGREIFVLVVVTARGGRSFRAVSLHESETMSGPGVHLLFQKMEDRYVIQGTNGSPRDDTLEALRKNPLFFLSAGARKGFSYTSFPFEILKGIDLETFRAWVGGREEFILVGSLGEGRVTGLRVVDVGAELSPNNFQITLKKRKGTDEFDITGVRGDGRRAVAEALGSRPFIHLESTLLNPPRKERPARGPRPPTPQQLVRSLADIRALTADKLREWSGGADEFFITFGYTVGKMGEEGGEKVCSRRMPEGWKNCGLESPGRR